METRNNHRSLWTHTVAGAIRVAFGLAWALDAYFKWRPVFFKDYLDYITGVMSGQPNWILPWFKFWGNLISLNPDLFAWSTRIIESLIAFGVLFGFARKYTYILGVAFGLLIWSIPEGFGGPYRPGATDIGAGLIYIFVFISLMLIDYLLGKSPYSLDFYLEKVIPSWHVISEWAPSTTLAKEPPYLPLNIQIVTIIGLLIMLAVFLLILGSELNSATSSSGTAWVYLSCFV